MWTELNWIDRKLMKFRVISWLNKECMENERKCEWCNKVKDYDEFPTNDSPYCWECENNFGLDVEKEYY